MLIKSKIVRADGTHIRLGETEYHFKPDASGDHVAHVTDPAHIQRLLSITEGYAIADRPVMEAPAPVVAEAPKPEPAKVAEQPKKKHK